MRRIVVGLIALAVVAGAAAVAVFAFGGDDEPAAAKDPLAYDETRPLAAKVEPTGSWDNMTVQEVAFAGFDGARVTGLMALPPLAEDGPRPCVVYVGGLGATRWDAQPLFAGATRLGIGMLAIEAREHGDRQSSPNALEEAVRDPRRLVATLRATVLDLRRALDFLVSREDCDPRRLGYVGVSLGGLAGTILAGRDERVRATVVLSIGGRWADVLEDSDLLLPGIEDRPAERDLALRLLAPYEPADWIARIAPRPVLLVDGRRDRYVPVEQARRLADAAREPFRFVLHRGGHDPFRGADSDRVAEQIAQFLTRELVDAEG